MTPTIDLFWSFRSPYCYLLTPRLRQLVQDYDLKVRLRPVYPLAIRRPEFFATAPSQLVSYVLTDTARTAAYLGMPFRWPSPDPIVQDLETREISPDQPYAYWLTHLGMAAEHLGGGLGFACEVARLIWSGEVDDWTRRTNLQGACARADLSLEGLEASMSTNPRCGESGVLANQGDHDRAGHWGVPLCVFDGEPFFGQDRFDTLVWRLKQRGIRTR
jgi:2-hydroxychromene-2-carboxylate isomerase